MPTTGLVVCVVDSQQEGPGFKSSTLTQAQQKLCSMHSHFMILVDLRWLELLPISYHAALINVEMIMGAFTPASLPSCCLTCSVFVSNPIHRLCKAHFCLINWRKVSTKSVEVLIILAISASTHMMTSMCGTTW